MLENDKEKLGALGTYIDGKMKRYSLMFAVNGGAFAVAKLMGESSKSGGTFLLGNLRLWQLALGAIIFTIIMVVDIYIWGKMMKREFLGDLVFKPAGQFVLFFLGVLLVSGWGLVASG